MTYSDMFGLFKTNTTKPNAVKHFKYTKSNTPFDYTIIRKSRMQNCYIRIKENKVIITAGHNVSISYLQNFVDSKAKWIIKQLLHTHADTNLLDKDAKLPLYGNWYKIKIEIDNKLKKESLLIEDDSALFKLKQTPTIESLKEHRDKLYQELAQEYILPHVTKYASLMDLQPSNVTFRKTKSRWGSCSYKNNISLNTRLMMLPQNLIDYIIIHELSHIKHKNHSKEFWNHVQAFDQNHKQHRKSLRPYEALF